MPPIHGSRRVGHGWATELNFGGVECKGHAQYPAMAPDTASAQALRKWRMGFLVSLYLLGQDLPQLRMHTIIFSRMPFLCRLAGGETGPEHNCGSTAANSPRSQVPACLNGISPITSFELYALRVGKVTLNWKEWTLAAVSYTEDSPWKVTYCTWQDEFLPAKKL